MPLVGIKWKNSMQFLWIYFSIWKTISHTYCFISIVYVSICFVLRTTLSCRFLKWAINAMDTNINVIKNPWWWQSQLVQFILKGEREKYEVLSCPLYELHHKIHNLTTRLSKYAMHFFFFIYIYYIYIYIIQKKRFTT